MTYEEIHERLARLTDLVDIPKIEALRVRIERGREAIREAHDAGKPNSYTAPAGVTLEKLHGELEQMELNALAPFNVAQALAQLTDDLAGIVLPKGSVVSASIPGVCDWQVSIGLDLIPF